MDIDADERNVRDNDHVNDIEDMSLDEMNTHVLGEDVSEEVKIDDNRSPDSSEGEGPRMKVAKRTRRNAGKKIVLHEDNPDQRTWAPIETGMVLRADGTVMKSDEPEGAAPHEGQVQVGQPRSQWAVIIPRNHNSEVEGDAPHEGQVQVSLPQTEVTPAIEYAHAISERILMINEIKEPLSFRQIFNRSDRPQKAISCT
ncbi:hypothetical protein V1517DRAFT_368346 [Lipomyces orientalis]|uniref:Uncharacterized protein n=1 Tax=Lipomyces orientalis TaxID=1233043 RepID=A0ACC3TKR2_9ASCO